MESILTNPLFQALILLPVAMTAMFIIGITYICTSLYTSQIAQWRTSSNPVPSLKSNRRDPNLPETEQVPVSPGRSVGLASFREPRPLSTVLDESLAEANTSPSVSERCVPS